MGLSVGDAPINALLYALTLVCNVLLDALASAYTLFSVFPASKE